MRTLLIFLAAAILLAGLGCERKASDPAQPTQFDPELDGPPSWLGTPPDEDLIKDQRKVAKAYGIVPALTAAPVQPGPAAPAPAPAAAGGDSIEQVKQTVGRLTTPMQEGMGQPAPGVAPGPTSAPTPTLTPTPAPTPDSEEPSISF